MEDTLNGNLWERGGMEGVLQTETAQTGVAPKGWLRGTTRHIKRGELRFVTRAMLAIPPSMVSYPRVHYGVQGPTRP
jgi:hypothetical protein